MRAAGKGLRWLSRTLFLAIGSSDHGGWFIASWLVIVAWNLHAVDRFYRLKAGNEMSDKLPGGVAVFHTPNVIRAAIASECSGMSGRPKADAVTCFINPVPVGGDPMGFGIAIGRLRPPRRENLGARDGHFRIRGARPYLGRRRCRTRQCRPTLRPKSPTSTKMD